MSFDLGWIIAGASALGAFAANLLSKFFSKSLDSLFERWRFAHADKRKLADEILNICAEAQSDNYNKFPENERKIYQLLTYLESIESTTHELFNDFYTNWLSIASITQTADLKKAAPLLQELKTNTEKKRKKLVRAVGKWKK